MSTSEEVGFIGFGVLLVIYYACTKIHFCKTTNEEKTGASNKRYGTWEMAMGYTLVVLEILMWTVLCVGSVLFQLNLALDGMNVQLAWIVRAFIGMFSLVFFLNVITRTRTLLALPGIYAAIHVDEDKR